MRTHPSTFSNFLVKFLLVLGVYVATLGCATAYAPVHDLVGDGYRDSRLDSNTWRVSFAGNSSTSRDTVEKYLLYRCAEITNAAGFDYFLVVETNTSVHTSHAPDLYQSTTRYDGAGNATTTGQYLPGASSRSHVARATIRAFKGAKPSGDLGAFDASELLAYLGQQVTGAPPRGAPARGERPSVEPEVAVGERKASDRQIGKWEMHLAHDQTTTSLSSEEKQAVFPETGFVGDLNVTCLEGKLAVWIEVSGLRFARPGAVIRFDSEPASWTEMTSHRKDELMAFADYRKGIMQFSLHDRMFAEVSLRTDDVHTVLHVLEFDLRGFSEAVKPVLAACR